MDRKVGPELQTEPIPRRQILDHHLTTCFFKWSEILHAVRGLKSVKIMLVYMLFQETMAGFTILGTLGSVLHNTTSRRSAVFAS